MTNKQKQAKVFQGIYLVWCMVTFFGFIASYTIFLAYGFWPKFAPFCIGAVGTQAAFHISSVIKGEAF